MAGVSGVRREWSHGTPVGVIVWQRSVIRPGAHRRNPSAARYNTRRTPRTPDPDGRRMTDAAFQRCIHPGCATTVELDATAFRCPACGGLLDVAYDRDRLPPPRSLKDFEAKWSRRTDPSASAASGGFLSFFRSPPPKRS